MPDIIAPANPENQHDNVEQSILQNIEQIVSNLSISRIYFIDDAVNLNTEKATFIGLVEAVIADGKLNKLREINIQNAINFNTDEAVLIDHINEVWDQIKPGKQLNYYRKIYTIAGQPEAINDLNVSNHLKEFFPDNLIEFLTPNQWDEQRAEILQNIPEDNRIVILFDQDLKLADGRFSEGIQGEQLIVEQKGEANAAKVIMALFTHTITDFIEELPKRKEICDRLPALTAGDFFVLAKSRLQKHALFADGLKKVCLNTFCEDIKTKTIELLKAAQEKTISKLEEFDTYAFDHTVFKSSFTEGVWEPETLLRITDVIFKDELRTLMCESNYVPAINSQICDAQNISGIEFKLDEQEGVNPYTEQYKLRNQELYESPTLLNQLRRPIDNGDIFVVTDGEQRNKKYILLAQECDLMVRSLDDKKGKRGARTATLLEIETYTETALFTDIKRFYEGQIAKKNFLNHFYADKFKLEYFENGTNKVGIVSFSKTITIDLNVLDLIVFNETGEAVLDLEAPTFNKDYHNFAWRSRFDIINSEFVQQAQRLDTLNAVLLTVQEPNIADEMAKKLNRLFSFITQVGIQVNYDNRKFNFGIKRIARLRLPKSKNLLDRYYQHLSRFAELHDFAGA